MKHYHARFRDDKCRRRRWVERYETDAIVDDGLGDR